MFGPNSEGVTLKRDVEAVVVPMGDRVNLPEGTACTITQSLGGSFTVYIAGNLFRIDGKDADALGKEPNTGPELPENATDEDVEALVWEQMKTCFDPEIPINIVDLGLIYECRIEAIGENARKAYIQMTLTAPGCGMGDILVEDVRSKVLAVASVEEADVEMVFDPPWSMDRMSEAAKIQTGMI
jgi:probable FeS assembly SUF system protein SufT